ncbi:cellulose binding domain-containing protein [Microbispora sp. ATCC PTA-5024]|uniref:cellulose binding domain-containing protein n=1 Tax=Microbispora sp. ATCC PTA-5024 TaxID=316330 RepID=UPI0003DD8A9D|nr:cellulose binding domain-containing protein [Microbispora sp. ATCC PTA-5024]ETK37146.1 hypothetical protein MPTA5024_05405 [Microbispora sp. ATCC PTA-5024]
MPVLRSRRSAVRGGLLLAGCAVTATAALVASLTPAAGAARNPVAAVTADTTPPSTPGGLTSRYVQTDGAAGLAWKPSTDDVGVTGYEVYAWTHGQANDAIARVNASITTSADEVTAVVSGLIHGRNYLFSVVAVDAAGNRSVASLLVRVTAAAYPPIPSPTPMMPVQTPTALRFDPYPGEPTSGFLSWNSSGNPAGTYFEVFRRSSTGWDHVDSTSLPRTMVSTGSEPSYAFQVVSRGTSEDLSTPSEPLTVPGVPASPPPSSPPPSSPPPSSPPPSSGCAVTYTAWSWPSGFTTDLVVRNTGATAIDGWRLEFAFPLSTQHVTSGWSATWAQSGTAVSATNLGWNTTLKPGASVRIGFNGTHSGSNPSPTAFTLNGRACTTG